MTNDNTAFRPFLTFLSEDDKKKIHEAALEVLENIGMTLTHDGALDRLKKAGCRVEADNLVKVPRKLVENAVKTAPNSIRIYNREGELAMDLGGRRAYYGTGSDLMFSLDSATMQRHRTSLDDIRAAARVCDALPNIDFIMSFAHPHEVDPKRSYLESFKAMAENSVKPIVNTADSRRDLSAMQDISRILRGSDKELREKPYCIQYDEPISPLKHPFMSVDKLIYCAEAGMPVIYSPAPIAGSTAPITVAGHVVQGLAECFFGLVIHQLTAEGAPFLMGMGAAVLDMATSQCSYNAPEYLMAYQCMIEMSKYFDIPNWGYAGTSDSQIPDQQAAYEAGLLTYIAEVSGSNLNHDVGYLDFGLTGSLDMIVMMNEAIDQIRRMQKGVPVNDDTIGLNAIREAGRQGHFLTHPHTLKYLRATQWRPKLISRQGHEKWVQQGGTSMLDRARTRLNEILEGHRPAAIESGKAAGVDECAAAFKG